MIDAQPGMPPAMPIKHLNSLPTGTPTGEIERWPHCNQLLTQKVAAVKLHPRRGCEHVHAAARSRVHQGGGQLGPAEG